MRLRAGFGDLPLQRKLFILVALAALLALLIAAALLLAYELSTYLPRAREQAREQVQSIAATVTAAVDFDDPATATNYLNAFGRQRDVRAMAIVTQDGRVFAQYVQPGAARTDLADPDVRARLVAQGQIVAMQPIHAYTGRSELWIVLHSRPFAARLREYAALLGAAVLSLLALTVMLSLTIRRAISEPVKALAAAARDVTERQDYGRRVESDRNDELGQLARDFNAMLAALEQHERDRERGEQERLALEAQLRQSQKMQALGTLAGGIAHDFNNVLTAVAGNARLALEDLPADHTAAVSLREISRGTERARDLVRRILAFSRPEQNVQHLIDLRPVVDEALRLLRATAPRMIEIRLEAAPDLPTVRADATQVHQVLMNLGANACDAMKDRGGVLTVRLSGVRTDSRLQQVAPELHPGVYLRVSVEDTGAGIDPELIERVFEPFFTTKAPGEGTGLGLSVVHGIMRGHGGAILLHSKPGAGTVFDLYFPAAESAVAAPEAEPTSTPAPAGEGERILYVDDEEQLVFLVKRMMERMGYRTTGMTDAAEAVAAVRADPYRFDLVISDLGMPNMSGMDLATELLAIRADLPIIITSGYVRSEDAARAQRIGVRDIVLKPGTVAEMAQLIRERLDELRARAH